MTSDLHHRELPRFIRDLLASPPAEGTGLHQWIFRCACALKPWRAAEDAAALIAAAAHGTRRNIEREIRDAIRNVRNTWDPGLTATSVTPRSPSWPARDDALIAAILADGFGESDLWEASPRRFEIQTESNTAEMLQLLFPDPATLLCLGWQKDAFRTRPRERWATWPVPLQFIVPSPMTAPEGLTKDGRMSPKTTSNTGPRRYLICEFDFCPATRAEDAALADIGAQHGLHTPRDLAACIIRHLASLGPLVLVIWSGGKSLHAWFPVTGVPEEDQREFFKYAVRLGADPATWTRSQFVRVPYGTRRPNGALQTPVYFNPTML